MKADNRSLRFAPALAVLALSLSRIEPAQAATWVTNGPMTAARENHTATLLPNGKLLVAGGYNGSYLPRAELYDPATGTWTLTGSLNVSRANHTATLLPNGRVLVAGGVNSRFADAQTTNSPRRFYRIRSP